MAAATQFFAFGFGYVAAELARTLSAQGWTCAGTVRSEASAKPLAAQSFATHIWPGSEIVPPPGAAWLISVPPDDNGCPVFRSFGHLAPAASWIGYLSTTGVYGDLAGGWAFEETPFNPQSREAMNRATAEAQWTTVGARTFRLPGIYGPGRSAIERVKEPGARRIVKPGQLFSRAHVADIASALELSISKPATGAFNICDDEPAPADDVLTYAASLLGIAPPPAVNIEDANLSPMAQRFYAECKRVSNAKAKAALGWRSKFPTYREGLQDCLAKSNSNGGAAGPSGRGHFAQEQLNARNKGPDSRVRIGVWNLECVAHKDRNPNRLEFLRARNVDIWVLTETHSDIDLSSSHPHAAHSAPRVRSRNDMHWVSIWSRFPIMRAIQTEDVRTAIALLDTPVGEMLMFGTVWPWHSDKGEHPGEQSLPNWSRQGPVIAEQSAQWSQLKAEWPDSILCVAGDLNMTFGGPRSYASKSGRIEAEAAMQAHDLVCTTEWARLPNDTLDHSPIDHVLLPTSIAVRTRVSDAWRGYPREPDRLSDHSGLVVEIGLAP